MLRRLFALSLVACTGCALDASRSRYQMATFLTTRTHFQYVQDGQTGKWVNRACELRVSEARVLPEPLQDDAHGSRLSVQIFKPETVESGLLLSIDFRRDGGYRVWPAAAVLDEDDLIGKVAYGGDSLQAHARGYAGRRAVTVTTGGSPRDGDRASSPTR